MSSQPIYTYYCIPPDFFVYGYEIDNPYDTGKPYAHLLDEEFYEHEHTLHLVRDFNNAELINHEATLQHFRDDLLYAAEVLNYAGAYTCLGALEDNWDDETKWFKKAAEAGSPEGMTIYGQWLCRGFKIEEGWSWVRKAAEAGYDLAEMYVGLAYHFGSFEDIDYKTAEDWYLRAANQHHYCYAAYNLSYLYADAGMFHTALHWALLAKEWIVPKKMIWGATESETHFDDNINACRGLLCYAISERRKHCIMQQCSNLAWRHFFVHEGTFVPKFDQTRKAVSPNEIDKLKHIDKRDLQEVLKFPQQNTKASILQQTGNIALATLKLEFDGMPFLPNQHEILFWESAIHAELNKFLTANFHRINHLMRQKDCWFTYFPASVQEPNKVEDIIGYYLADSQSLQWDPQRELGQETQMWQHCLNAAVLPPNCAGLLRYNLTESYEQDKKIFDFTLIPSGPGTNWNRVFNGYAQLLESLKFLNVQILRQRLLNDEHPISCLVIDNDFRLLLPDFPGGIKEVKMPVLSKVIYMLYLRHPEGIAFKNLYDYKEEMYNLYREISRRKVDIRSIEDLVDATSNSLNEKVSRIHAAFMKLMTENEAEQYLLSGKKGEIRRIRLPEDFIKWKTTFLGPIGNNKD